MPRVQLSPLPKYIFSFPRAIERSDAPGSHFDNVSVVQFVSDAQQRFFGVLNRAAAKWEEENGIGKGDGVDTVNGDLQVTYKAQTHRFDTLRIDVGVVSISRVAFRLSFVLTRTITGAETFQQQAGFFIPLPEARKSEEVVAAVAEVGVVQVDAEGRPVELRPGFRKVLEQILEAQGKF
ncbi:hypothetical protein HDU97_005595 [Phlyctochytrium planicorne]|nr:hypothetical protein HDU97_005595 [Phlyctochytrium planicorne]